MSVTTRLVSLVARRQRTRIEVTPKRMARKARRLRSCQLAADGLSVESKKTSRRCIRQHYTSLHMHTWLSGTSAKNVA